MQNNSSICERIKAERLKKKWSASLTARKLKIPLSTFRDWEKGATVPAHALPKLASVFGISLAELLNREEEAQESLKKAVYYLEAAIELVKSAQS